VLATGGSDTQTRSSSSPIHPGAVDPGLPCALDALVERATALDPAARFEDAKKFEEFLRSKLRHDETPAGVRLRLESGLARLGRRQHRARGHRRRGGVAQLHARTDRGRFLPRHSRSAEERERGLRGKGEGRSEED
jgi:hypothetical protein